MSENLTIIFGVVSFTAVLLCPFVINKLTKYKLELEKMRLEADVRKEEIRCRNQLELDKFINGEQAHGSAAAVVKQAAVKQNEDVSTESRRDEMAGMFEGVRTVKQAGNVEVQQDNSGRERLKY